MDVFTWCGVVALLALLAMGLVKLQIVHYNRWAATPQTANFTVTYADGEQATARVTYRGLFDLKAATDELFASDSAILRVKRIS